MSSSTPMSEIRALVCGGRAYPDIERVFSILDQVRPQAICHGGASRVDVDTGRRLGADYFAGVWARERGVYCQVFPADWQGLGKRAGYVRNKAMLDSFEPNLVIAFPGGPGTENMMTLARSAHVKIMQVLPLGEADRNRGFDQRYRSTIR